MVLVRIVLQAKLGHAGFIAADIKKNVEAIKGIGAMAPRHVRILTDLSGQFDRVIEELEFDTLDDFMKGQDAMFSDPRWQEMWGRHADHLLGGSKEYYTVEYAE
jgi:hypothetical protein